MGKSCTILSETEYDCIHKEPDCKLVKRYMHLYTNIHVKEI